MTDQRELNPTEQAERSTGANSAQTVKQDDSALEIVRLAERGKAVYQERAAALRTELAQVEEQLRRFESIIAAAQGRKITADRAARAVTKAAGGKVVDPVKSARANAAWDTKRVKAELETKLGRKPTLDEIKAAKKSGK